jgi:hypothetical protein
VAQARAPAGPRRRLDRSGRHRAIGRGPGQAAALLDAKPLTAIPGFPALTALKNQGLGFAIPYMDHGQLHDYIPDFIIRLNNGAPDPGDEGLRREGGREGRRCPPMVDAVNAEGSFGLWCYAVARNPNDIPRTYLHGAVTTSGSAMARSVITLRVQEFDKGRGPVGLPPIG